MKLIVDGLAVEVYQEGKGKPVLMLHGWKSEAGTFAEMSHVLANKFNVIRVDLPGFGHSEVPPGEWDLKSYASFIAALLKKLNISKLQALIGHSLGGRIAIKSVALGKVQTSQLVLIGSHGINEAGSLKNRFFWVVAKIGKILVLPLPNKIRVSLRRRLYSAAGSTDYLDAGQLREIYKNIIGEDLKKAATRIKVPTLLVYGELDNETPVKYGEIFNNLIADSKLEVVANAGHYVHQDKPQAVTQIVSNFIEND